MDLFKELLVLLCMQKKLLTNFKKTNFTAAEKKFVLSLHYNGDNSYLFVNGTQELKFKTKDDQIFKQKLCVGNISDDC